METAQIIRTQDITPDSDLSELEVAIRLCQAFDECSGAQARHFLLTSEWLPFNFFADAEQFFGGRYTEEEIRSYWLRADDHLYGNIEDECEKTWASLNDEQRACIDELAEEVLNEVYEMRARRAVEDAFLAELAKEFE